MQNTRTRPCDQAKNPMRTHARQILTLLLTAAAALSITACGDDDEATFEWEGVYTISTWTENPTGCEMEGPSVADAMENKRFVAHRNVENFFGQTIVSIVAGPCADPQSCSNDASAGVFGSLFGGLATFTPEQRDGDVYRGRAYAAVRDPDTNTCTATVSVLELSSPAEGQIRRERRVFPDVQYMAGTVDGEPDCLEQDAAIEAALASASCGELEVIVAADPQELPPPQSQE